MTLLGDWNWYLPSFLEWLPRITVEAEPEAAPVGSSSDPGRPVAPLRVEPDLPDEAAA